MTTRGPFHEIADAVAAEAVKKLREAPVGKIECEFPTGWHNSRGRARQYLLRLALEMVPDFAAPLLDPAVAPGKRAKFWAAKHGLSRSPWAIEWAEAFIREDGPLPVLAVDVRPFIAPAPRAWTVDQESRVQYRAYIERYLDIVKKQALEAGMVEQPPPLHKHEQLHFQWLVRFQFRRESLASIARDAGLILQAPRQTIHKAIKSLARDVGLKLRQEPRSAR